MAFQDFINNKASEKAAIEAALVRVIAELQAANSAAPAVDSVVSKIQELMVILQSSPSAVVTAAKEAIRESCGDISLLVSKPREVSTLTIPKFIVETANVSPVLADLVGETTTDSSVTLDVSNTTPADEILPFESTPKTDAESSSTEETNKPKRRTQVGFNRKVEEWGKILDNLNADNYESGIAKVADEYEYWVNGTKFASDEIVEKSQEAITHWTSQDVTDSETEEETIEDAAPEETIVATPVTVTEEIEPATEDLSSFDVTDESEETQVSIAHTELPDITTVEVATKTDIVETPIQHYTQSFLDKLNAGNLSEAGLGDLQEEITTFYGGKDNIPQELEESLISAWGQLDTEDDSYADSVAENHLYGEYIPELSYDDVLDINDGQDDTLDVEPTEVKFILDLAINDSVYDGDIPEDEELQADDTAQIEAAKQTQIAENNLDWQNSILTKGETWEDLEGWDKFLSNAIRKDDESVTPETLEALDTLRERLEAREVEQTKAADNETLITDWLHRLEFAFDESEAQSINDEIRTSGILDMRLIKAVEATTVRLSQAVQTPEPTPEPSISEEEQIARDSISNQWEQTAIPPITVDKTTQETEKPAKKKNPFAGRKTNVQTVIAEEATAIRNESSDYVSISKINTSGIFNFKTLEGSTEQHKRFDDRYILEPGVKLYEPSTSFVFEIVTWEEAKSLSLLMSEDANKLSLKSLHSPARSYSKAADKTDVFVVVSDQQANDLVAKYRARLSQIDADAAVPMQVGS